MQVQQLVSLAPWTVIAQICNLLIQIYLVKRFLFKPINAMLEKRRAMADAQIQDAIKAKDDAESMKAEYEQNMKDAKDKANEILTTAQKTATVQSEEMIREATQQAANIKAKAESDIAQERIRAVNEIKDEIGSMAMEIAGKAIGRELREEDHKKLINEFIANVGEGS